MTFLVPPKNPGSVTGGNLCENCKIPSCETSKGQTPLSITGVIVDSFCCRTRLKLKRFFKKHINNHVRLPNIF